MLHQLRCTVSLRILFIVLDLGLLCAASLAETPQISVIPKLNKVVPAEGSFTLTLKTLVAVNSSQLKDVGQYLSDLLIPATGMKLAVRTSRTSQSEGIVLRLDKTRQDLGDEGYTLKST